MNMHKTILQARKGFAVRRLHIFEILQTYNNGNHSANAAFIAMSLANVSIHQDIDCGKVAAYMLLHDLPEALVGDIPSPTKRALGPSSLSKLDELENSWYEEHNIEMPELNDCEKFVCKFSDLYEVLMFADKEVAMGNCDLQLVVKNATHYLLELIGKAKTELGLHHWFLQHIDGLMAPYVYRNIQRNKGHTNGTK